MKAELTIRESTNADVEALLEVERLAFGQEEEANLVADLLEDPSAEPVLSLVAVDKDQLVGHILFTRVRLEGEENSPLMHILAPVGVRPEYQHKGIGGALILEGFERLKKMGSRVVLVLGHMEYYPRYGFIPGAAKRGFIPPYPIRPEYSDAWMVAPLHDNLALETRGRIVCADLLNKPEYWVE